MTTLQELQNQYQGITSQIAELQKQQQDIFNQIINYSETKPVVEPRDYHGQRTDKMVHDIPMDSEVPELATELQGFCDEIGYTPNKEESQLISTGDGRLFNQAKRSVSENSLDIRKELVRKYYNEQRSIERRLDVDKGNTDLMKARTALVMKQRYLGIDLDSPQHPCNAE